MTTGLSPEDIGATELRILAAHIDRLTAERDALREQVEILESDEALRSVIAERDALLRAGKECGILKTELQALNAERDEWKHTAQTTAPRRRPRGRCRRP
jgi:uncharacterized coiled-coil DUF342 family protein